jgi:membrane-associated protease RseP (regulator of RpoE activity)
MEQDMSEKSSTPDVPAEDVAAAQRAADAGGVTAELGGPVVVATPDVVTPAAVAPPAPPVPSATPAVHGSGGGWQAPPTATVPPGSRPSGLRPSWPLVIGAAVLAAIIAAVGTGLIVGFAVHRRDQVSARGGQGVYAPYQRLGQNNGAIPNPMRQRMRGGTNQAPQGTLPGNGSGTLPGNGTVSRGYLGASVADTAQGVSPAGAEVRAVQAGSPAQKAGLAVGDVITAVNGTTISNVAGLMQVLDPLAPGSTLKLTVSRSGQSMAIDVTTVGANDL